MTSTPKPFLAAAVQSASVFLDRDATLEKSCDLIAQAGLKGAKLIVLPEAMIPGYPAWVWTLPLSRRPEVIALHRELVENAVDVPGPVTEELGRAARAAKAWVTIGVDERDSRNSRTTLFNTLLIFDDQGNLVNARRKLMPTGGERMVWAQGEAVVPRVFDTPLGRLGGLLCWENYMPLVRFALYEQGAQIHVAPTWDSSPQWIASMRHVAREGRMYVIGVSQAVRRDHIPDRFQFKDTIPLDRVWINPGNSLIVDPEGLVIAGPLAEKEDILYAEIDPGRCAGSRWIFDAAGHYNRPDLFTLVTNEAGAPRVAGALAKTAPRSRAAKKTRAAKSASSGRNGGGGARSAAKRSGRAPARASATRSRPARKGGR
jgi:nitrilase